MIDLRDFYKSDIESIAKYANNFNVSRYMTSRMPYPYTADDAKWWVETGSKEPGLNMAIDLAGYRSLVIVSTGVVLGAISGLFAALVSTGLRAAITGVGVLVAQLIVGVAVHSLGWTKFSYGM